MFQNSSWAPPLKPDGCQETVLPATGRGLQALRCTIQLCEPSPGPDSSHTTSTHLCPVQGPGFNLPWDHWSMGPCCGQLLPPVPGSLGKAMGCRQAAAQEHPTLCVPCTLLTGSWLCISSFVGPCAYFRHGHCRAAVPGLAQPGCWEAKAMAAMPSMARSVPAGTTGKKRGSAPALVSLNHFCF